MGQRLGRRMGQRMPDREDDAETARGQAPDHAPTGSGAVVDGVHRLSVRVYYADTDAGGIVYHARYLDFAERARTEFLRLSGPGRRSLLERGLAFVVRRAVIDWRRPAVLDDLLTVETRRVAVGGADAVLDQRVLRGSTLLAGIEIQMVCIATTGRPSRLPPTAREAFLALAAVDDPRA